MLGGGSCGPVRGCVALRRGPKVGRQRSLQSQQHGGWLTCLSHEACAIEANTESMGAQVIS